MQVWMQGFEGQPEALDYDDSLAIARKLRAGWRQVPAPSAQEPAQDPSPSSEAPPDVAAAPAEVTNQE